MDRIREILRSNRVAFRLTALGLAFVWAILCVPLHLNSLVMALPLWLVVSMPAIQKARLARQGAPAFGARHEARRADLVAFAESLAAGSPGVPQR